MTAEERDAIRDLCEAVGQLTILDRDASVHLFDRWVIDLDPVIDVEGIDDSRRLWIREHAHELAGGVIGCWCDGPPCHAYTVARMADEAVAGV